MSVAIYSLADPKPAIYFLADTLPLRVRRTPRNCLRSCAREQNLRRAERADKCLGSFTTCTCELCKVHNSAREARRGFLGGLPRWQTLRGVSELTIFRRTPPPPPYHFVRNILTPCTVWRDKCHKALLSEGAAQPQVAGIHVASMHS